MIFQANVVEINVLIFNTITTIFYWSMHFRIKPMRCSIWSVSHSVAHMILNWNDGARGFYRVHKSHVLFLLHLFRGKILKTKTCTAPNEIFLIFILCAQWYLSGRSIISIDTSNVYELACGRIYGVMYMYEQNMNKLWIPLPSDRLHINS